MSDDDGINSANLEKLAYGGEALNYNAPSSFAAPPGSGAERVALKWQCTLQEAEHKISRTMEIVRLDRDNAIAFLDAVALEIGRQPTQPPNSDYPPSH